MRVPNLFLREPPMTADRLYVRLWMELRQRKRWDEIVEMCRRVRGYWVRSRHRDSPRYLIGWEVDALIALGHPERAFRQYRRWLAAPPRRDRLRTLEQRLKQDPMGVVFQETTVLYASGRLEAGRRTLEAWLHKALNSIGRGKAPWTAYGLLHHLENGLPEPNEGGPTLVHFYNRLGRRLDSWEEWERWVDALEPRLFRMAGISRRALLGNSGRLAEFVVAMNRRGAHRTGHSSVTFGQRDLVEPVHHVRRRHDRVHARIEAHSQRMERRRRWLDTKWAKYFHSLP